MISPEVMQELLAVRQVLHYLPESQCTEKGWTDQEQQLFWVALTKFPQWPWTAIAAYIGSKTTRQAMTHAQKLRQKLKRWNARLRSNPAVSSLLDGVTVAADGSVTVSGNSLTPLNAAPYDIPLVASTSLVPLPPMLHPHMELESKDHEQHGVNYAPTICTAAPSPPEQAHNYRRLHTQMPETTAEHATLSEGYDVHATISHDFVDKLAKSLWQEDIDDDEVTEEELKELDDRDFTD